MATACPVHRSVTNNRGNNVMGKQKLTSNILDTKKNKEENKAILDSKKAILDSKKKKQPVKSKNKKSHKSDTSTSTSDSDSDHRKKVTFPKHHYTNIPYTHSHPQASPPMPNFNSTPTSVPEAAVNNIGSTHNIASTHNIGSTHNISAMSNQKPTIPMPHTHTHTPDINSTMPKIEKFASAGIGHTVIEEKKQPPIRAEYCEEGVKIFIDDKEFIVNHGKKGDKGDDGKSIKGDKGDKGDDGKSIKGDKGEDGKNHIPLKPVIHYLNKDRARKSEIITIIGDNFNRSSFVFWGSKVITDEFLKIRKDNIRLEVPSSDELENPNNVDVYVSNPNFDDSNSVKFYYIK